MVILSKLYEQQMPIDTRDHVLTNSGGGSGTVSRPLDFVILISLTTSNPNRISECIIRAPMSIRHRIMLVGPSMLVTHSRGEKTFIGYHTHLAVQRRPPLKAHARKFPTGCTWCDQKCTLRAPSNAPRPHLGHGKEEDGKRRKHLIESDGELRGRW